MVYVNKGQWQHLMLAVRQNLQVKVVEGSHMVQENTLNKYIRRASSTDRKYLYMNFFLYNV